MPESTSARLTLLALWNLRALALFLLGPTLGVGLVALIFGMPVGLLRLAGAMFLLSLALFGLLLRSEHRRVSRDHGTRRSETTAR